MRGIYLQLKQFYSVHRIFLHKKISVAAFLVFNFHFLLTLALVFHRFFLSKNHHQNITQFSLL
jgi:hypothetical protein